MTDQEPIKPDDHPAAARKIGSFIAQGPNVIGGADIWNLDFGSPATRAGMLAGALIGVIDTHGRRAIRRFVVILPPGTDRAEAVAALWSSLATSFKTLSGRELQPDEIEALKARLDVLVSPDLRQLSVLAIIAAQVERAAVIVTEAAVYRSEAVEPYIPPGAVAPQRLEDVWVPQLHSLAAAATKLAREKQIYVALDANELSPRRQAMSDLLMTIEGCGVIGSTSDNDPETLLATRLDQWESWLGEGRLGKALQDVETLPSSFNNQKSYLRIQLLYRAGHLEQALQEIRERLKLGGALDPSSRVKLARIAQDANASMLAAELLQQAVESLNGREDLESALATAHEGQFADIEERLAARLEALFPSSASVKRRQIRRLVRDRNYAGAASFAREMLADHQSAVFYDALARHLSIQEVPDYQALIAEAGGNGALAEDYRLASVRDALARRLLVHAFDLVSPLPPIPAQALRREQLLLETLEALLLASDGDGKPPIQLNRFEDAVLSIIERLAASPDNRALRVGLIRLLQPSVAGMTGLALMASLVLRLASRPIKLRKGGAPGRANMDWLLERKAFVQAVFEWMKTEEPVVIGRSVLPVALLTEPPDEVVSAVADYLTHAPPGTFDDTSAMLKWLAFGTTVSPHSSDPDYDLRLIRLVAGKLASAGDVQQARDLAEQALLTSVASARRRRLGWFAMADVYGRGNNTIEGLLGLACTLAADDSGDEEEIFQEVTGVARLLRDCGLVDQARAAVEKARQLLNGMGLLDRFGHQLGTLELQLRQLRLNADVDHGDALPDLLVDAISNGRDVLNHGGLTAPAAALLGQLIRTARLSGTTVPPDAEKVFDELLQRAGGSFRELIAAMAAARPTAKELFAVVQALGPARYSDDVGFDVRNLATGAGRALTADDLLQKPEDVSFVLDLLADRGVAVPGWDEIAAPAPPPAAVGETAKIACSVSEAGMSVVQVGFDEEGRLVRLATSKGALGKPVRETVEVISEQRLKRWATDFPYAYGFDDAANLFYTTTSDLRLSELPEGPVVVAADTSFQSFPPNLVFFDGEFAGRTRPMAAVPSLTWLGRARENPFVGDGRRCAWISTATVGDSQTLPMISERLQPTFEQHGFTVDNGQELPAAFAGATMAVVTAHGGLHPEGRYFQVVSDEGLLRVTAADLSNALRNIGVVVLFVCSGGRADKHPTANTTLGLSKLILDRGCSAVIASPWPLDARVPSHWLPTFLEKWTTGSRLIEANFEANRVVDHAFGKDPARGLAMTLFGNPELSLPRSR